MLRHGCLQDPAGLAAHSPLMSIVWPDTPRFVTLYLCVHSRCSRHVVVASVYFITTQFVWGWDGTNVSIACKEEEDTNSQPEFRRVDGEDLKLGGQL